eukprot:TRINITY_DN24818_c0_g1_i1.p1 TRINITY_DN24818_c0_g1~~TRINITY_DN24818_c0_g1_i1.p1  ORF type:complete len:114 (-),score=21.46 TRINITY_DN24818_c0_g1_i1:26-367(-)
MLHLNYSLLILIQVKIVDIFIVNVVTLLNEWNTQRMVELQWNILQVVMEEITNRFPIFILQPLPLEELYQMQSRLPSLVLQTADSSSFLVMLSVSHGTSVHHPTELTKSRSTC